MTALVIGLSVLATALLLALAYDLRHRRRGSGFSARAAGASRRENRRDDHIRAADLGPRLGKGPRD